MISFGGFLNSNFWSSYRQASNSIDELLNKDECTVESLLNDDDCLQEFKSHNEKLLNYFEHDKIAKLIEMITEMPSQDVDHSRGHKFPFLSSEIFGCENNVILDKFFEAPGPSKPKVSANAEDDAAADDNDRLQGNNGDSNNDDIGALDEDIVQHDDDDNDDAENAEEERADEKEAVVATADAEGEDSAKTENKEEDPTEEKKEEASADQPDDKKVEEEVKAEVEESSAAEQKDTTTANEPESESNASEEKPSATVVNEPEEEDTATTTEVTKEDNSQKQEPEPESQAATEDNNDADAEQEQQPEAEKDENEAQEPKDEKAADAEEQAEEEPVSKYILLDKLFSFIETKEKPLNPVLAGYFQKLVTILLNRKQRQLLPYIFAKDSPVMDNLLYHVYQKSISEVLNKFVNLSDNNCSDELAQEIKAKQQHVMNYLSDKLSPEYTEEDNLNAATIIGDLMENKEFFQIVAKQQNIRKLVDFSLDQSETSTDSSRVSSVQVLTQIIRSAVANLLIQDNKKTKGDAEGEDMFIIQDSDEDEEELISKPIVEILKESLPKIERILENISNSTLQRHASYTDEQRRPLGRYNLSVIELLFQVLKLNKQPVYDEFKQSTILKRVLDLVTEHPWNNFLQLKANQIFEEVITSHDIPIDSRIAMIEKAELFSWLTTQAKEARFTHSSGRSVRNGYMGFVIKLGNILKKQVDDLAVLFKNLADDSWTSFVDGELRKSNEINQRNLGGQQPFNSFDEEEDSNSYEQNMEKIMQRFTSFTNQMSSNNSNNDDKDDNDEDDDVLRDRSNSEDAEKTIEVTLPEDNNKVDTEFADGSYWRVDTGASDDLLDELLADYE